MPLNRIVAHTLIQMPFAAQWPDRPITDDMRRSANIRSCCALIALLIAGFTLAAEPQVTPTPTFSVPAPRSVKPRPAGRSLVGATPAAEQLARRVVRKFDFEERKDGNFETMPRNWSRVTGPGFPAYTDIAFDKSQSASADTSLKLQVNGGSVAIALERGSIAVIPAAHYRITSQLRTHSATHSRARLVAYAVDQAGNTVEGTRRFTDPLTSNDRWTAIELDVAEIPPTAAWLVIRLELLQPDQLDHAPLGPHDLTYQDIDAAAWFDDVTVLQLPRIELGVTAISGVVRQPQVPRLAARVDDLSGDSLTAVLTVFDHNNRIAAKQERTLDPRHPGVWDWDPPLPGTGWYWAELRVETSLGVVGRAAAAMAWLPPMSGRGAAEADRFQILADDLTGPQRQLLPDILEPIGPQAVTVGLWRADMNHAQLLAAMDQSDPVIERLLKQNRAVTLSFPQVPAEIALAAGTDVDRPLDLLARDTKTWAPYLQVLMARYGYLIRDWQLGRAGSSEAFWRPDLADLYHKTRTFAARYVSEPQLTIPWSAQEDLRPDASEISSLLMRIPTSIQPKHIPDYAKAWTTDSHAQIIAELQTLDPRTYSAEDRAADLAFRMIQTWRTDPRRLAIRSPWAHRADDAPLTVAAAVPDPILPVWVNVAEQLAGRRYVGKLNPAPGLVCYLLDGPTGGALVTWSKSRTDADADFDLYLGPNPTVTDIWGNRTPLKSANGKQQLRLTPSPQFIEGVDMPLARFRAGFAVTPALADSTHDTHHHTLHLFNPWSRTLVGRLRITGPNRWEMQPRLTNFSIPAGQTLELPLDFTFPISESAGEKLITAHAEIEADRPYELDLAASLSIGLADVNFQCSLTVEPGATPDAESDIVITAVVSNLGEKEQAFYGFALAPDQPRQERIITPLKSGETSVKRFRFPGVAKQLAGKQIRVGLRQSNGPAILNQILDVP